MNCRDFSSSVRSARLRRGWSQEQLARELGVSSGTIYRLEAGRIASPKRRIMVGLRDKLGLSSEELLGPKAQRPAGA